MVRAWTAPKAFMPRCMDRTADPRAESVAIPSRASVRLGLVHGLLSGGYRELIETGQFYAKSDDRTSHRFWFKRPCGTEARPTRRCMIFCDPDGNAVETPICISRRGLPRRTIPQAVTSKAQS